MGVINVKIWVYNKSLLPDISVRITEPTRQPSKYMDMTHLAIIYVWWHLQDSINDALQFLIACWGYVLIYKQILRKKEQKIPAL